MFNPNQVVAKIVDQSPLRCFILLAARVLLAAIFVGAGWGKLQAYDATVQYMQAAGVSGGLLPLVIFAELGGGLAILFGFQTRIAALGLAVFSVLTGILFHYHAGANAAEQYNNSIHFMKNLAMAGGFLALLVAGAGRISVDGAIER